MFLNVWHFSDQDILFFWLCFEAFHPDNKKFILKSLLEIKEKLFSMLFDISSETIDSEYSMIFYKVSSDFIERMILSAKCVENFGRFFSAALLFFSLNKHINIKLLVFVVEQLSNHTITCFCVYLLKEKLIDTNN